MNILGRSYKIIKWILLGKDSRKTELIKDMASIVEHIEIHGSKEGMYIGFKRQF